MTVASTEIEASHLVLEIQIRFASDQRLNDTRVSLRHRKHESRVFILPEEPQKEKTISEEAVFRSDSKPRRKRDAEGGGKRESPRGGHSVGSMIEAGGHGKDDDTDTAQW